MFLKFKSTIMVVLVLATIASAWLGNHYRRKFKNQKEETESLILFQSELQREVETYRNKYDQAVARNEAIKFETATIKELVKKGELQYLKQFEGLNKRLNNLESTMQTNAEVIKTFGTDLGDTIIYINDSVANQVETFHFKDDYLEAKGLIYQDSLRMENLVMQVPLNQVVYWERQHWKLFGKRRGWLPKWFSKKKYISEVTSPNPDVSITELSFLQVRKK